MTESDDRTMRLTRHQIAFLIGTSIFLALQILPHQVTSLVASGASFFYIPLATLLLLTILLGIALSLLVWIAAPNEASKRYRRNRFVMLVLTLTLSIGLTAANFAYTRGLPTGSFARSFNQQAWSSSPHYVEGDITERQKMLGSAIHDVVIDGEKDDIIKTLGPTEEGPFSTECDLVYTLGPQRTGFPIDDEWLLIWFDDRGRVVRYDVWTD